MYKTQLLSYKDRLIHGLNNFCKNWIQIDVYAKLDPDPVWCNRPQVTYYICMSIYFIWYSVSKKFVDPAPVLYLTIHTRRVKNSHYIQIVRVAYQNMTFGRVTQTFRYNTARWNCSVCLTLQTKSQYAHNEINHSICGYDQLKHRNNTTWISLGTRSANGGRYQVKADSRSTTIRWSTYVRQSRVGAYVNRGSVAIFCLLA